MRRPRSPPKSNFAFSVFERTFKDFGLPAAIRTDNGTPFAASWALFGLSARVWWLRLGIDIERIKPGQPQQNGRHERLHLTLKKETTQPAAFNFLQQQERFDDFIRVYNHERRTRRSAAPTRPTCIHRHPAAMSRRKTQITRSTIAPSA